MPEIIYENLPFDEAIEFFRGKVNVPTEHWDDLWKGMHSRGFMVAGAMQEDMLESFRQAIDKALAEGTTLAEFQKTFDEEVARTGWSYHGTRGWRTSLVFNTNLRTSYAAGRYKQMTDPDVLNARPYWIYRHGDSIDPRPEHLAWDGLVLPADDPWWDTHYPPNGWGCTCRVFALSEREIEAMGKKAPDKTPKTETYKWKNRAGETHTIPKGIDPGWDYNPGKAAYDKI